MTQEKKQFNAEIGKILHLMIHSLYSNKEIFMRELISNASDACDKLRYLAQIDGSLISEEADLKITISINKDKRQITIKDNGIGMSKTDLIENLGTIARSGTQNFIEQMSGDAKKDQNLIGQFGVGFYSAFMVGDEVSVNSRKAGEDKGYNWHSDGAGEYMISDSLQHCPRGTEIIIHVKENEDIYLDHFRLKNIVKSYSDHIAIPIYFIDEGNIENQVNTASALWTRPKSEISAQQYKEFYKSLSYSQDDPWIILHNKNEGALEFINLLFIPSTKTFDLFHPDRKRRVKLYIKRVFIADENIDLIPHYLRFLRGIVDSADLPLNISRDVLQHNPQLEKIRNAISKRVLAELKKKKNESVDDYLGFWDNFGGVLKEGLCEADSEREKLLEVCMFKSALHDKMISLDDYINNCHREDKTIYYLSGDDPNKLRLSPQIEGFLSKNIDVLLFTDSVDDFWVNVSNNYQTYEIKSVTRSNIDLEQTGDSKEDKLSAEQKDDKSNQLISYFKLILGNLVKDVQISKKLTSSPACLAVSDGAMDIRMERFLIEQKQLKSSSTKILELNPKHKIIQKINNDIGINDTSKSKDNETLVKLIFDQACIIEGEPVSDVHDFVQRLNDTLERNL